MSQDDTPTSSITDEATGDTVCSLCGRTPICGGMGVVRMDVSVSDPRFGKLFRCPNYQVNLDPERQEKLRKLSNLHSVSDKRFDNFRTDLSQWTPSQQDSLRYALEAAARYAEQPEGWLLLDGTYGCGKTHLAAAIGNVRLERGEAVLFITSPDLLDHLRSTYGPSSEVAYDEMFDRVRNAPLLVLDDLGTENPSQWAQEKLFQLLNYRYSMRLPTVITTNADLDTLDPRVRSRLMDTQVIHHISIKAPDFRSPIQNQKDELVGLTMYADMRFETFDTRTGLNPEDRANLERALEVARRYVQDMQGWLLFVGPYGTGKTHLAAAIANECQQLGNEVVFVTVPDLLDYLRTTYNPGATSSFEGRFQMVRGASLLVLDDLGTESATAWAKEKLFQIINYRYVARLPTIVTTARPIEEMDPRIRTRLLDRRNCVMFALTAPPFVNRMYRK